MPETTAVDERQQPRPRAVPLPHDYTVSLHALSDGSGVLTAGARPQIAGGPPPQFGGQPDWWSPEHLLLSAVSLCLMATFQAFMARQPFEVRRYASTVKGMLDKTADGIVFTSIVIDVAFETAAERVDEATRLLEKAKRHCIVSNALRTPVDLRVSTTVA